MDKFDNTMKFNAEHEKNQRIKEIIKEVYEALDSKGYNAVNQITGYLLSGDPAYITSHNNARVLIRQIERDEILEALVVSFLENEKLKGTRL
ncbi:MAG: IreB family regulatory phosphoprotein [Clostridia bacterium]